MLNKCLAILCIFLMTGCSGRIDLSDVATTAGATAGAVAGAAIGGVPAVAVLTITGGAAGGVLVEDSVDTTDVCVDNPELCNKVKFWDTLQDFVHWIIGGVIVLIVAAWVIPGPQSLWRKKDGRSDSTNYRPRSGRRY